MGWVVGRAQSLSPGPLSFWLISHLPPLRRLYLSHRELVPDGVRPGAPDTTFTRSSHTYTRTERTEISKTRGGETKREVRVEESTQAGGDPFPAVFGDFLGRERLGLLAASPGSRGGEQHRLGSSQGGGPFCPLGQHGEAAGLEQRRGVFTEGGREGRARAWGSSRVA